MPDSEDQDDANGPPADKPSAGGDSPRDPRKTAHPVGEDQAAQNADNEPPG